MLNFLIILAVLAPTFWFNRWLWQRSASDWLPIFVGSMSAQAFCWLLALLAGTPPGKLAFVFAPMGFLLTYWRWIRQRRARSRV